MIMKDKENLNTGHRNRIREKFIKAGLESFLDYEKLELLLTYAIPRRDIKPIAKELLKKFKSISAVLEADIEELIKIKGIQRNTAIMIKVVREFFSTYMNDKIIGLNVINSPKTVIDFCKARLYGKTNENYMLLYLDNQNQVIKFDIIQEGTIDKVIIYPRKIIERVIKNKAKGLILVHNHIGNSSQPSKNDIYLTDKMLSIAKKLDIDILDHIIICKNNYFSFQENNFLN